MILQLASRTPEEVAEILEKAQKGEWINILDEPDKQQLARWLRELADSRKVVYRTTADALERTE